jgi:hypothetical protein
MVVQPRRDPTNLFPQILQRELSEQVTLVSRPPGGGAGITKGSYIEAVQQRFAVGDREKVWETVWSLSPSSTQQYWLLGTSQLDVDARLGF